MTPRSTFTVSTLALVAGLALSANAMAGRDPQASSPPAAKSTGKDDPQAPKKRNARGKKKKQAAVQEKPASKPKTAAEKKPSAKSKPPRKKQPPKNNGQPQEKKQPAKKQPPAKPNKKPKKSGPPPHKLAFTDPIAAGPDFETQGEYTGQLLTSWGREPVGLQVIAQGNGKFTAVLYRGGLPGDGWNGQTKTDFQGERESEPAAGSGREGEAPAEPGGASSGIRAAPVILRSKQHVLTIGDGAATLTNTTGQKVAELEHVLRESPNAGLQPPPGAMRLFYGSDMEQFRNGKMTPQGFMLAGATTKRAFGDFHLHVEFRTPFMPLAKGQARGNSGAYLQERYEVQILDSFGLEGVKNECGALYRTKAPDINMCYPPLSWQTYDIYFRAARFDPSGQKVADTRITVVHNGVIVHNNYALPNKTGAGKPEGPEPRPIRFQDHGNPVVYRNIWLVEGVGPAEPAPACCCRRCRRRCWLFGR